MRHRVAAILTIFAVGEVISVPSATFAASHHHKSAQKPSSAKIIPGLGFVQHPVSTKIPQAQKFFDQGLAFTYGFDHESAQKCFEQAAKLDPKLAMAWWGVALALGPNINIPIDPEREKAAYQAIQRALALQENASHPEQGYINALAFRYSNDPKADLHQLDVAYREAMAKLVRSYPDDLDAATLYAECMMNLHPWRLWFHDGRPNEGTEEIVAVLESVLKRNPNHLGANHYYIHAVEGSSRPERALPSAIRLETLAPAAGHLTHMPSHIHARVGDYAAAVRSNERAIIADGKFFVTAGKGLVAVMYHAHNEHFLAYAACMADDFKKAKKAADVVAAIAEPHIGEMPEMEGFLSNFICARMYVLVAFEGWDDILKLPPPKVAYPIQVAAWHFGRTLAFAAKSNATAAEQEQAKWQQLTATIKPDEMINETNNIGSVLKIQSNWMSAAIARSRHSDKETIDALTAAISAEDVLDYNEPPGFFPPMRPVLGRSLMAMKRYPEAEKIFRAALEKSPRLPSALAGLRDSLRAQNRTYEAEQIEQQMPTVGLTRGGVTSDSADRRNPGRFAE
ncbi:MAG TPA: hypothetical protein VGM62_11645 [Chthoniobacterales bacterium]